MQTDTLETDAEFTLCLEAMPIKMVRREFARNLERQRNAAYASLREMIDLNEVTGDPDPEVTQRARALLPENVTVDLPDTAAQESTSKSNNPAVSG